MADIEWTCTSIEGRDPSGPPPPPPPSPRRGEKAPELTASVDVKLSDASVRADTLEMGADEDPRGISTTLAFCSSSESSRAILSIRWQNRSSGTFDKAA